MSIKPIPLDYVRTRLAYDPLSGDLTWISKEGKHRIIGRHAGTAHGPHRATMLRDKHYQNHRLAWALHHGVSVFGVIDHINGDSVDNRISNLREASLIENAQNLHKPSARNKLGVLGVYFKDNRYIAKITAEGRAHWIGTFTSPEEASAAYLAAKERLHAGYVPLPRGNSSFAAQFHPKPTFGEPPH